MAKNMKKHMCNDSCKGRTNTITCFMCGELFYSKCFSLDIPTQTKINSIDSCLRFVCGTCQSNFSTNKRKSLGRNVDNSQSSTNTAGDRTLNDNITKILDLLSTRSSNVNANDNGNSTSSSHQQTVPSDITAKIDTISKDLKHLVAAANESNANVNVVPPDDDRNSNENQRLFSLHAKLDHFISIVKSPNNSIHDSVIKSLDDLQCKMDVIIADPQFTNKRNNKLLNKNKSAEELEWSFSFNHSLNTASSSDNADLVTMITNFEQNTWAGFDLLSKKLSEQQKSIHSIGNLCKDIEVNFGHSSNNGYSNRNDQQISSALIDSINIDTLQHIQNKCDKIEQNLSSFMTRAISCSHDAIPSIKKLDKSIQTTTLTSTSLTQASQNPLDETSGNSLIDIAQVNGVTNAVHVAGMTSDMALNSISSDDVRDNSHSVDSTNAVRLTIDSSINTASASTQASAGTHNVTEILSDSLLINELDSNISIRNGHDESNTNSQPITSTTNGPSNKLQRQFHLSRLSINTTADMIYEHIRKMGISDTSNIRVTKLVPLNRDHSTLSFISFKVDTNDEVASVINSPTFWPPNCAWKDFIPKKRPMGMFNNTAPFLAERRHQSTATT